MCWHEMCVFFKLKVKGHCYGIKDRRYLSPSSPSAGRSILVPRSPTSSARRIIYNCHTATKPSPTSHCSAYVNCARTLACCDRWRMLCLWPAAVAFFNAPPSAVLLITLICLRRTCSEWILRRDFLDWSRWKTRETLAQSQWSHRSATW